MKKIAILGSTGSIGTQTLDVCDITGEYLVDALTAHSNVSLLENQIRKYKPRLACMTDEKSAADLKTRVRDMPVRVLSGADGGNRRRNGCDGDCRYCGASSDALRH